MDTFRVKEQFDNLALYYDSIKKKNPYYFNNLKKVFKDRITGNNPKIIEIGCGTGEILKVINPHVGVGIDISSKMIEIAKSKYPQYSFYCQGLEDIDIKDKFDYVILPDIIEYITDLNKAFRNLKVLCKKTTTVILTSPNPLWSFILDVAGKLNLKMKDKLSRPHSRHKVISIAEKEGFKMIEYSTSLLLPKKVLFSNYINENFRKIPILKNLGFIQVFVLKTGDLA